MAPSAKVALVFAVCAAPLVLGWLAYEGRWALGGKANYGELLAPRALAGPLAPLRGKWVFVTVDAPQCAASCEKKLYVVRQVRRAQGGEAERIERLWLVTGRDRPRPELLRAIEGTRIVASDAGAVKAFPGNATEHVYLVDPLGNLMMRFPAEPDARRMIQDLERLLKYSRFG